MPLSPRSFWTHSGPASRPPRSTVPSVGLGAALGYEVVLTAFLMFVIAAVATDSRAVAGVAGVAVGGAVAMGSLVGGGATGASMNPARTLGPAIVSSTWTDLWIYLVAPPVGALVGVLAYRAVSDVRPSEAAHPG